MSLVSGACVGVAVEGEVRWGKELVWMEVGLFVQDDDILSANCNLGGPQISYSDLRRRM